MKSFKKYFTTILIATAIIVFYNVYPSFFDSLRINLAAETIAEQENTPHEEPVILIDDYGIAYEQFQIDTMKVKSRQTLGTILTGFELDHKTVERIVSQVREFFDPRFIRAGNTYKTYFTNDSTANIQYFVYDISASDYLKIKMGDSLEIIRGEKPVTTVSHVAYGTIFSSLYATLAQNNLNPELAIKMSEILAWEVDFYRIHAGDEFKVVYEERFVGSESIGISRIDALYFVHQGREIYGFKYENDTVSGYYGVNGENLKKAFLAAPIKFGRISSGFSQARMHPVLRTVRPHYGTDYAAPAGTPIYAVGDGVITEAKFASGNGNYVRIRHNSVYDTQYLHMSKFAAGMKPGKRVKQGEVIGYVGMTGLATGPHVCFRFWKNGQQVDHRKEKFPSADPLHPNLMPEFKTIRDQLMQKLESVGKEERLPV
jgi:murein DD-endopeptidase MepM/ murein hydrolase activator NlpD